MEGGNGNHDGEKEWWQHRVTIEDVGSDLEEDYQQLSVKIKQTETITSNVTDVDRLMGKENRRISDPTKKDDNGRKISNAGENVNDSFMTPPIVERTHGNNSFKRVGEKEQLLSELAQVMQSLEIVPKEQLLVADVENFNTNAKSEMVEKEVKHKLVNNHDSDTCTTLTNVGDTQESYCVKITRDEYDLQAVKGTGLELRSLRDYLLLGDGIDLSQRVKKLKMIKSNYPHLLKGDYNKQLEIISQLYLAEKKQKKSKFSINKLAKRMKKKK